MLPVTRASDVNVMRQPTDLSAYREVLAQTFVPLEAVPLGDASAFYGRVRTLPVADLQLCVVSGSSQVVSRTRRLAQRSSDDLFKVGVQLRAHGCVEQDGRVAELTPGDITVYDTSRPYRLTFQQDFAMLVLVVPRSRLAPRAPCIDQLTAVAISGAHGSGALASSLLRSLGPENAGSGAEALFIGDAAVDLLAAALVGCAGAPAWPAGDSVMLAAQRCIEDRLADPLLNPTEVARAAHVSLRQLQKLFERRGTTITAWIRGRRLERCWHDLGDPRLAHRPVAAVAASWGFPDAAQFSRAFRSRYGVAPRDHRAQLLGAAG